MSNSRCMVSRALCAVGTNVLSDARGTGTGGAALRPSAGCHMFFPHTYSGIDALRCQRSSMYGFSCGEARMC